MRARFRSIVIASIVATVATACAGSETGTSSTSIAEAPDTTTTIAETTTTAPEATTTTTEAMDHAEGHGDVDTEALAGANLGAAAFQDVEAAEAAGYASTMESLGCFENPDAGGMGLHYLREDLLDASVDEAEPEALVYELDHNGEIDGLVAHEYLVPLEAWTSDEPPTLFGLDFHEHPVLPFWILHAWLWKDNPTGMFQDWNPKVRMCPDDVPIFGVDLP